MFVITGLQSKDRLLALSADIRLGWELLRSTNTLAYYNYDRKKLSTDEAAPFPEPGKY